MHSLASRYARRSMTGMLVLTGCATIQPPPSSRDEIPATRFARMLDSIAGASVLNGDELFAAPRIRLVVPPASYASTQYVDASFHVSEDAYVLVVAVDLDRRLRVVYPKSPEESGFAARSAPMRLTRFFAGFGGPRAGMLSRYETRYSAQRISPFGGGGVLLAVASDRPLQYDRLTGGDGDWDEQQLAQIVFDQSLAGAAYALGRALALTGQEYNTDYTTFNGRRSLSAYSALASNSCGYGFGYGDMFDDFGFGSGLGSYASGPVTRFVGFFRMGGQTYARYGNVGPCNQPVYYDVPVATPAPGLPTVPDTTHHDSATTRRPLHPGAPRFPSVIADKDDGTVRRFAPRDNRDVGRARPVVASGLRFRPPEQVPSDAGGLSRLAASRGFGESPARHTPMPNEGPMLQRGTARHDDAEGARAVQRATAQHREPHAEPARVVPVRAEPARAEPAREPGHVRPAADPR